MADPTEAVALLTACGLSALPWRVDLVKHALATARAEGRRAGMEEAARGADAEAEEQANDHARETLHTFARAIRARAATDHEAGPSEGK